MKYKAVIFDFDNTISQTKKAQAELMFMTLKSFLSEDVSLELDLLKKKYLEKRTAKETLLFYSQSFDLDYDKVLDCFYSNFSKVEFDSREGFWKFFNYLKRQGSDVKLLLVTNRLEMLDERLSECGLSKSDFDFWIQATSEQEQKPSGFMMQKALEFVRQYGIEADEVLSIGDNVVDFQSSKLVGFCFVGLLGGSSLLSDFNRAGLDSDLIFENLVDIYFSFRS